MKNNQQILAKDLKKFEKLQKLLKKIDQLESAPRNHPRVDFFKKIAGKAKKKILMKKEFTIKIYSKKAGAHYESFSHQKFGGGNKKEAFELAREELIRIANCDIARGVSESSEKDILEEIKSIESGANNYYYDQTTYSFKIFSKKSKT
jgi:hypothetical protein